MKLDFEKWLDEKYENKLLSHIDTNAEAIKNIFEESIICYKSCAYRASIVMAMIGFNMIMRDRLLKYKDSLESLDKSIHFENNNLINDNTWDRALGNFIINNKKNFDKIFPNKSNWNNSWIHYRDMRNISAHGKGFKLHYNDIESLYSWIIQAFDALYPVTALETLIEDINIFFDISKTPENKSYKHIINNSLYISTEEEVEKIFTHLYSIYSNNINNKKVCSKIINILLDLSNKKEKIFINIVINFIKFTSTHDLNTKYIISDFLINLLCSNQKISMNISYEDKYYFLKNGSFSVMDYDKLYYNHIINEELLLDGLSNSSFEYLEKKDIIYICDFIDIEIEKRCKKLLNSYSYDYTRSIVSTIPYEFIKKHHVFIILEAYKTNSQVSNENYKVPYLMNYISNNFDSEYNRIPF